MVLKKSFNLINWLTSFGGLAQPRLTRFLRYSFTGGISTVVDLIIFTTLTLGLGIYYLYATAIGFVSGAIIAYGINRVWTFRGTKTKVFQGYLKSLAVDVSGFLLTLFLMFVLVDLALLNYFISRIVVIFLVLAWNFTLHSNITFRN